MRKKIRLAIKHINQSEDIQQLRDGLHELSRVKGWGNNITLEALLKSSQKQMGGESVQFQNSLQRLQAEQFSSDKSKNIEALKKELMSSLRRI